MDTRWCLLLALLAAAARAAEDDGVPDMGAEEEEEELALDQEESRNLRPRAYTPSAYNTLPSGFRPTPSLAELAGYQRPEQEAYLVQRQPQQQFQEQPQQQQQHQQQQHQQQQHQQQQQQQQQQQRAPQRKHHDQRPLKLQQQHQQEADDEEEDKEEPDRLATLLQQSKFDCGSKQSGYYADEDLNCEVFHYCQDSVKHSWICPEGFTFHQVHLICMPPTHDNICQTSSKYHFVNEYLYRPINEEEVQRKPNVSLKYSDRYYPAEIYNDDRYDGEDESEQEEEAPRRHAPQLQQLQARPSQRQQPQVFRSAEEVNIPLVQRRPQRPYDFDF